MKLNQLLLLSVFSFTSSCLLAQTSETIRFKNGFVQVQPNIRKTSIDSFNISIARFKQKAFVVLQFETIPTEATKKLLSANGIELLEYIPNNAYTATVSGKPNLAILEAAKTRAIFQPLPEQKMEARLAAGLYPSSAIKVAGTVDVWISFPGTFSPAEVISNFKQLNVDVLSTQYQSYHILSLRVATNRLKDLASQPFVEYVQPAPSGDQPLNFNSRYASRANVLNASIANGGKGLNGEGIVVGVGDAADVQTNIDFAGRLIDRSKEPVTGGPTIGHGFHTTGTVAGAGNGNELYRGYAPKATIVSQSYNGIILNAPTYVNDYGMVVTNNSYGDNIECGYYGTYDLYSRLLDQMAFDLPNLTNVFSAGNSGFLTCPPFLPGYHTVLGGYQSAKNVITVGATTDLGAWWGASSMGPVKDGRLKPEITAMGDFVASAWTGNIYSYSSGTSMAGPAVAGGVALLCQRYRQLNSGANPKNGLMKALICNGAADIGNPGPDFKFGYGWLNLLRSIDMMENNHYFIASSTQGATNNHTISVPANTAQLKVMLYWNDPAASMLSAKNLVNDLDLEVTDGSVTSIPKILDTANARLTNNAVSGADHSNNMEQVVINNPAAGNYTFTVKGTAITQNPSQEYFLVYDPIPVQLKITAPTGGEGLAPSTNQFDSVKISWEAYGFSSGTATLELSIDGGSTWSTIATGVDINRSIYNWYAPNVVASQALVRITKDGTGETSTSHPFTIIGVPTVSLAANQCEGYINLNWNAITGATDYEVFMLIGDEMKPVATATSTSYTFSGLSKDSVYWVAVRARVNGKPGRRAAAISRQPNNGSCTGAISDNDLKIDAIVAPKSGRRFTSTQLSSSTAVIVRIKNLDDAPASNYDLKYSINGGAFVTENVTTPIAAGATLTYTFLTTADLSAPGDYSLVVVVKNSAADPVTVNDTAVTLVRHADNQPIDLSSTFIDNIETAAPVTYDRDTMVLNGLERYDFSRSTIYGRLRPFINTGIAYSGTKAITLDANRFYLPGNTNYFTGTFNLINYNENTDDVRLDFQYNNHGQFPHPANRVWIRGNDSQPWIEAYRLDDNQNDPGTYKKSVSIEVSDLLAANAQSFSTSFQVRWGQWGQIAATDKENAGGYSFDDIRVYKVVNDIQMLSIDAPTIASCGLTSNTTIKVSVRNSANSTVNNIPVKYRINNGGWVTETISSLAPNTTVQYSFTTPADLSAINTHTIQAIVDLSTDSFHDNDTSTATVINSPIISSFPYLENFEGSNGYWYADGKKSSWQYGTPASQKINGAASGAKAWKTRLQGNYNDMEFSYLYSPCFDLTGMTNPTLSFSLALDLEDCGTDLCDGAWVEYSADGITWNTLGASGQGTNWYNKASDQLWSIQNFTRWHVATIPLPTGLTRLRIRFVMASDPAVNREGIAVDDIHIYNNPNGIYNGATMSSPVTQAVSGNNWIDFTNGGKLVASIQPNSQNLGSTDVQAYINTSAVRYASSQYYLDRNITIKPATNPADSVTVRFYFLDTETDTLTKATGCPSCGKPSSAYELGVSKYSDPDKSFENGVLGDDVQGIWNFITPDHVTKVPFDKGYYAEFKAKDFSEFWLNNGGINKTSSLPIKLGNFTAQKQGNNVRLTWVVESETDVNKYEIELARGNEELQAGHFVRIGEVPSLGNTTNSRSYTFIDNEADKFGPRYYRLKILNTDGSFSYSPIRSVVFDQPYLWQVYPNPSAGLFSLIYQLNTNDEMDARIIDAKGSVIREYHKVANGFIQKLNIDMTLQASGVYLLQVDAAGKKQTFKLYKR
jgi:hypothetical protein